MRVPDATASGFGRAVRAYRQERLRRLALLTGVALGVALTAGIVSFVEPQDGATVPAAVPDAAPEPIPADLAATGLYADPVRRIVASDVMTFAPQYPLWTDGATKARWIRLPPGTTIDASDVDAWRFPVGTRIWKEFSFAGKRVETRFMRLDADGVWSFATYVWSTDGSTATLSSTTGGTTQPPRVELGDGREHRVPTTADCRACHDAEPSAVLGFSALQLSSDRDELAPHAEDPPQGAVTLADLVESGVVTQWPDGMPLAPRISARSAIERAARGYLHGNCGGCHRSDGPLAVLGMDLAFELDDPPDALEAPAITTTVARASRAPLPAAPNVAATRIEPGDAAHSVLVGRMQSRAPLHQMPPLGTARADVDAIALISRWIDELTPTHAAEQHTSLGHEEP